MVVNDCKDATEIDANNNLKSYTDEECATETDLIDHGMFVYSKIMTRNSDPAYYRGHGELRPYFEWRYNT